MKTLSNEGKHGFVSNLVVNAAEEALPRLSVELILHSQLVNHSPTTSTSSGHPIFRIGHVSQVV